MTRSRFDTRPRLRLAVLAVLCLPLTAPVRAAVLVQDAEDATTTRPDGAARWEALAVSSPRSSIASDEAGLHVALAAGDRASFSRAADLVPAPLAVACRFNVSLSQIGDERPTMQVFRMGWAFGASNADEPDLTTYARLGLSAERSAGGFQLRDLVGGASSPVFRGTQAVTWVANNSGRRLTYSAPNGTLESIGDDRMDVWVARTRVFDDVAVTRPDGRITDLKWFWSQGSGIARFDHFELSTLDEAVPAEGGAPPQITAGSEPAQSPADASIALERPTPNPFGRAMRFAYSIPNGSAAVDIGVFDIVGRRVRVLARGTQGAGQYEVRWDALGDDGVRVKHGVYFLRAAIGARSTVSRIVYVAKE